MTETAELSEMAATPVVVVTHDGVTDRLRRCVDSIAAAAPAGRSAGGGDSGRDGGVGPVIVVDNSGRRGALDGVHTIEVPNLGYGAAANAGFAVARSLAPDAVGAVLLNDDIVVADGWLEPLVRAVRLGAAAAQPKLLFAPAAPGVATEHARDDLNPSIVNSVGVILNRAGAGSDIGYGEADGVEFVAARDIEIFTGGAVLLSFEFLDLTGGFDERFFLYYEDVDLSLRGAESGCRYRCEPASVVWHEGGATTGRQTELVSRLQERNRLWCAFRFGSPGLVVRACWRSVKQLRLAPRRAHLRGTVTGISGGVRRLIERRRARRDAQVGAPA